MTATSSLIGVDLSASDDTALFTPGQIVENPNGAAFVYGQAGAAIDQYDAAIIGSDHVAVAASLTSSAAAFGDRIGAAQQNLAKDQWGWFQVYGTGRINTLASADANVALNTTATDGHLDDDGGNGAEIAAGIVLGIASPAESGPNATAFFNWPTVGATISGT